MGRLSLFSVKCSVTGLDLFWGTALPLLHVKDSIYWTGIFEMMHSTMKQIAIKNGNDQTLFARLTQVWNCPWYAWTRFEGRWLILGKCEEITLQSEIRWHYATYHAADCDLKWWRSADAYNFGSRSAEGAVVLWKSCNIRTSYAYRSCILFLCK